MNIQMKLKPFMVPNFVTVEMPAGKREDGVQPLPSLPLHSLEPNTLADLCDHFRKQVFAKAGKKDPAIRDTP